MQHLAVWLLEHAGGEVGTIWLVFDCSLLLMVSHWFPDTLHTVSLLFYCILCPGLLGWGMGETWGHGAASLT